MNLLLYATDQLCINKKTSCAIYQLVLGTKFVTHYAKMRSELLVVHWSESVNTLRGNIIKVEHQECGAVVYDNQSASSFHLQSLK